MVAKNLGANKTKLLLRKNSADVTGQKGGYVVGYAAIAIYKQGETKAETVGTELGLNLEDKRNLLSLAREAIQCGVERKPLNPAKYDSPIMNEKRGAFVTLTKRGALRGCIGYIIPVKPLAVTIQEMAGAAAFRDPRFSPVKKEEIDELEIEISVLTPLKEISDINEIEVGKHGLLVECAGCSGLLLPQVATEYGWDRETFLEHTCKKAGLPDGAWKDPSTKIKIFSAEIFHENE
ncbi:AmmeMemoRadiSam system protein A [candidate division KSB1 bacterium]|nr:AmmeMemoRadiSam system protein A [candidate division KSB1 bacterium]